MVSGTIFVARVWAQFCRQKVLLAAFVASRKCFGLSIQEVVCGVLFALRPETGTQRAPLPITRRAALSSRGADMNEDHAEDVWIEMRHAPTTSLGQAHLSD